MTTSGLIDANSNTVVGDRARKRRPARKPAATIAYGVRANRVLLKCTPSSWLVALATSPPARGDSVPTAEPPRALREAHGDARVSRQHRLADAIGTPLTAAGGGDAHYRLSGRAVRRNDARQARDTPGLPARWPCDSPPWASPHRQLARNCLIFGCSTRPHSGRVLSHQHRSLLSGKAEIAVRAQAITRRPSCGIQHR